MDKSSRSTSTQATSTSPATSEAPRLAGQDELGNAEMMAQLDPLRRVFEEASGGGTSVSAEQLERFLDTGLQFAEGEWFRGKKLSGAAGGLMSQLDTDRDGQISETEFEGFRAQTLAALAPDAGDTAAEEAIREAAGEQHRALDSDSDGRVSFGELRESTLAALPPGTEHRDLVAQLGARLAVSAVDTDQTEVPIAERMLSREEWEEAAAQLHRNRP